MSTGKDKIPATTITPFGLKLRPRKLLQSGLRNGGKNVDRKSLSDMISAHGISRYASLHTAVSTARNLKLHSQRRIDRRARHRADCCRNVTRSHRNSTQRETTYCAAQRCSQYERHITVSTQICTASVDMSGAICKSLLQNAKQCCITDRRPENCGRIRAIIQNILRFIVRLS